jgi:hypothetical protein
LRRHRHPERIANTIIRPFSLPFGPLAGFFDPHFTGCRRSTIRAQSGHQDKTYAITIDCSSRSRPTKASHLTFGKIK